MIRIRVGIDQDKTIAQPIGTPRPGPGVVVFEINNGSPVVVEQGDPLTTIR